MNDPLNDNTLLIRHINALLGAQTDLLDLLIHDHPEEWLNSLPGTPPQLELPLKDPIPF
jgi:hypothetical protein